MKLLIMQLPPISRHFISLRSKHSPQHPVLKLPQSMFKIANRSFEYVAKLKYFGKIFTDQNMIYAEIQSKFNSKFNSGNCGNATFQFNSEHLSFVYCLKT
jgi:hypothetical protein